jgi:hypothetical protein
MPNNTMVRLSSDFAQVRMSRPEREQAVDDAYYRTLSPHEWTWTLEQQARMALYCLWASQRIDAIHELADGTMLLHESNAPAEVRQSPQAGGSAEKEN